MSTCDATLVLFRSDDDLAERTVRRFEQESSVRCIWILHSACVDVDCAFSERLASSKVRFLCRPDNLGFAGGHNYLFRKAFADGAAWILCINPDLWVVPGGVQRLMERASVFEDGRCVLHGPRLLLGSRESVESAVSEIDSEGIVWTKWRRHFDRRQGLDVSRGEVSGSVQVVPGLTGACLMFSRQTYDVIVRESGHVFNPFFIAYREDAELGLRVQSLGGLSLLHVGEDFLHLRGSRNGVRGAGVTKFLSAQNRFLLKYSLSGRVRWWQWPFGPVRDLLVVAAGWRDREVRRAVRQARGLRRSVRPTAGVRHRVVLGSFPDSYEGLRR